MTPAPSTARPKPPPAPAATRPPGDFVELPGLNATATGRRLGYFRDERFVLFGFCPRGGEVLWKDAGSYGFGAGGWQPFLDEIAPLAARRGAALGTLESAGTHVLVIDRDRGAVYAAPRAAAEAFLARAHGRPPPARPCLCAMMNCTSCPAKGCVLHPSRPASRA